MGAKLGSRTKLVSICTAVAVASSLSSVSALSRIGVKISEGQIPSAVAVYGWGLAAINSFATDGSHLWIVTDCGYNGGWGDAILELSARTGQLIRKVTDVSEVTRILAASPRHLWLADQSESDIIQISTASGRTEHRFSSHDLLDPISLVVDGPDLWVANGASGITELQSSTGAVVRHIALQQNANPTDVALIHGDLWIPELNPERIAVFDPATGRFIRNIQGPGYHFDHIVGVVARYGNVWIQNTRNTRGVIPITEVSASTGTLVKLLADGYGFHGDDEVALAGPFLLVHNANETVSVIRASDDSLVRRISLPNAVPSTQSPSSWIATATDRTWIYDGSSPNPGMMLVDIASGQVLRITQGSAYGFNHPGPIASDGTHLWVGSGTTVTEISPNAGGTLLRVLKAPAFKFSVTSIAADAVDVWVLNSTGTITELSAATGGLVRNVSGSSFALKGATAIASDGSHVWVANPCGPICSKRQSGSLTELTTSGELVAVLSSSKFDFHAPTSLATDGTDVWVVNAASSQVTEIENSTGALVRLIDASNGSIAVDSQHVWITVPETGGGAYKGPGLLELSASSGTVLGDRTLTTDLPANVASNGSDVWVSECGCDFEYDNFGFDDYGSVAELSAVTGKPIQIGTPVPSDAVNGPSDFVIAGGRAWLTNQWGDSVSSFPNG